MSLQTAQIEDNVDQNSTKMDLTRSLLVICAHGSAYHPAANDHVLKIAEDINQSGIFAGVQTVFQAGQATPWAAPRLNHDAYDQIIIVPYMMSDGFLAKQMINKVKQLIRDAGISYPVIGTPSVGTHQSVANIALKVATEAAQSHDMLPGELTMVLVAHGSQNSPQSRLASEMHLQSIRNAGVFKKVVLAFIEEAPFVSDTLKNIDDRAIVVGLFAAPGGHAIVDIRDALENSGKDDFINAGPIGMHKDMHDLIKKRTIQAIKS